MATSPTSPDGASASPFLRPPLLAPDRKHPTMGRRITESTDPQYEKVAFELEKYADGVEQIARNVEMLTSEVMGNPLARTNDAVIECLKEASFVRKKVMDIRQFMLELMTHYREGRSSSTRSRPDAPLASNKNSLTGATFTSSQRVLTGKDRDFIRSSLEGPGPKNCAVAVEKLRNALEGFSGACREKGYLGEVRPMKVMMEQQNKNRTIRPFTFADVEDDGAPNAALKTEFTDLQTLQQDVILYNSVIGFCRWVKVPGSTVAAALPEAKRSIVDRSSPAVLVSGPSSATASCSSSSTNGRGYSSNSDDATRKVFPHKKKFELKEDRRCCGL